MMQNYHFSSIAKRELFFLSQLFEMLRSKLPLPILVFESEKQLVNFEQFLNKNKNLFSSEEMQVLTFPYIDCWGEQRYYNHTVERIQRIKCLFNQKYHDRTLILTTPLALASYTMHPDDFNRSILTIKKGQILELSLLRAKLDEMGYFSVPQVNSPGEYCEKGTIVEIFPANQNLPIRLQCFLDEIENIRIFEPENQRSFKEIDVIEIAPSWEFINDKASQKTNKQLLYDFLIATKCTSELRDGLMDAFELNEKYSGFEMYMPIFRKSQVPALQYFQKDRPVFYWGIQSLIKENATAVYETMNIAASLDQDQQLPCIFPEKHYGDATNLIEQYFYRLIEFGNPHQEISSPATLVNQNKEVKRQVPLNFANINQLFDQISQDQAEQEQEQEQEQEHACKFLIISNSQDEIEKLHQLLLHREIDCAIESNAFKLVADHIAPERTCTLSFGYLSENLYHSELDCAIVNSWQILGRQSRQQKAKKQKLQNLLSTFKELKVDDLVVHVQYGIGQYKGIHNLEINGHVNDFFCIAFRDNDKIYLSADRVNLLQKYQSTSGRTPRLDKLGGESWELKKQRSKKSIIDLADKLLKEQAQRLLANHLQYHAKSDEYISFEADFPYEETKDQKAAIDDIEKDFLENKQMDRLVCGDVGFGKTEVALRAAMRAVLEGFQVIFLAPTTILSFQHFRTCQERMNKYGVNIGLLNRFINTKEAKAITQQFKEGKVDILIGTHRLLSKDIIAKHLGLIIIDEEQKFGVTHKEKIKKLSHSCDILTLSATPIPRTMHMSLIGLKDISIISTPPNNRSSIKTHIVEYNEQVIKSAIEREVSRGGQVFFLHNEVSTILQVCTDLRSLIPGISVRYGHGQMKEHELERVILDFLDHKFSVLVCTTIIESGIDMPNVNTIIVNNAQRFGLSQLYQIRGRVGRSNSQAYAYLLTPPLRQLNVDALRRLEVLQTHQDLGSGFQIASHDMEIRGAGNLLGPEQSGHAMAIGLELYTELLEEAVAELRGEKIEKSPNTELQLPFTYFIPEKYIFDANLRLHYYKKIFACIEVSEIEEIRSELIDRFGKMPEEMLLLLKIAGLKSSLARMNALKFLAHNKKSYELILTKLSPDKIEPLLKFIAQNPQNYALLPQNKIKIMINLPSFELNKMHDSELIENIDNLLKNLLKIIN